MCERGRGEGVGGEARGGGIMLQHCHHQNGFHITTGSDESRVMFTLIVRGKVTRERLRRAELKQFHFMFVLSVIIIDAVGNAPRHSLVYVLLRPCQ